ncbi:uncharacterized protein KIAA2012 homolog [Ahaetulla prasina]|uniref:uncharacterized protein KIAA2012 homolog n=1 Tax=Ahaetulla prasina TaxID=499056 RepID=UPI002648B8D2|nr:uncharacterized protein KIAA2012 homolog [Ahaetulla prasina]
MSYLSLLSRGTGQVIRKKQEKLEVHFDPKDELNWMSPEGLYNVNRLLDHRKIMKEYWGMCPPKTYCTRRGTLFLYSEDVAKPWKWKLQQGCQNKSQTLCVDLHTLQDLARAILVYGSKQLWQDKKGIAQQPYLYFLRDSDSEMVRSMRPGYSAKRYLLKLSQSWNPSVLQKLQNAGYISDPLLFKENAAALRKKLQDLSAIPPNYNLHIFYTPCLYSQSELEEQTYSGVGPPLRKKSENKACLMKGDAEHNARETGRIPLRISVRKLSFHLQPQHSRESIWNQNEAHWQISEDRGVECHQGGRTKKEPHNCEMPNQSVNFPLLGNTRIDTSEFWCEQSHVNFYGGFFPGKKITYSVNQNHLKSTASRGRGLSEDTEVFPLINQGGSKEQDEITKKHRKLVPEFCKLPQIAESSPSVQREKIKPSELSKELVILPLLVQSESPAKAKSSRGTCSKEIKSETDVIDKQSALLPNDLVLNPKHRNKRKQTINDGLLRVSQDTFYLPLINSGKFALNDGKKRKREVSTGTDNTEQIESHKSTSLNILLTGPNGEIICPPLLRSVQTTDNPREFELTTDEEAANYPNSAPPLASSKRMSIPLNTGEDELSIEVRRPASNILPEICSEDQASNDKQLCVQYKLIMNVHMCAKKLAITFLQKEFLKHGLGEDELSIEVRRPASNILPEICSEDQASNDKETIQLSVTLKNGHYAPPAYKRLELPLTQQTQHLPRNGTGFENHEVNTGNESVSAEFGERHQPRQTGLCRNSYPQQSEEERGYSSLSQTRSMKQRNASDIMQDEGEQLDSSARSTNLFHYEPHLSHLKISTSEIRQAPNPEHASIKPFDYHEEVMENPRIDLYASEIFGMEEYMTALSESTSQPAGVAHLTQAEGVLKSKRTERPKKQPIQKAGDGLKKQKKSLKKEKNQSQTEFVVGKPRKKRIIRKTIAHSKGEPTLAKQSVSVEERTYETDSGQEDVEAEPISCLVEEQREGGGGGGRGDQSLSDSSIFMEDHPLTHDIIFQGKPRKKRIIRKTIAHSKGEPTLAKQSVSVEERTYETDSGQEDVEAEPISCLVEEQREGGGGGGRGDQSLPDSSIFMEDHPLTHDINQTFSEEVGNISGFHPGPTSETSIATYKAVSAANGSQADAEQGNQLMEDLSLNKEELKLSRDRLIAERAEKRRLAVETKRKEQEVRKRKEQEEQERMEKMREEMEQEKQRRIEEFRLRKQQLEAERQQQEEEAERERQAEKAAQDQARWLQEEQRRRFLEIQRKKQEQELKRAGNLRWAVYQCQPQLCGDP